MWEREFRNVREIQAVDKEAAPTLNLVCVVERSKVSEETEIFFKTVLNYLGYGERMGTVEPVIRSRDLAEQGIVLPPVADRLTILEVRGQQVALVFECRDDPERSLLIGCSDLTTELLQELQRDPEAEPPPRGHVRLAEKNRIFSTRERARVVFTDYERAGELPLTVIDFEGVTNVSNAFASEFLYLVREYCLEQERELPELRNMVPFVEKQVRWVVDNQANGEFEMVPIEAGT
ncbi:MAG TPA: hypothetical protein VIF43_01865 [Patescibacteria group bacterium]|jgi:hypothetical protein